jgi:hypothetical protein
MAVAGAVGRQEVLREGPAFNEWGPHSFSGQARGPQGNLNGNFFYIFLFKKIYYHFKIGHLA